MMSICEKNISAEVQSIDAEQMSLYNFTVLRKKQTQLKTEQLKQNISNEWEYIGHYKLIHIKCNIQRVCAYSFRFG